MVNKSRAIVKSCPKCDHSVAVASKSCKNKACGHSFFDAKRTTRSRWDIWNHLRVQTKISFHSIPNRSAQSAADEELLRRRTKRVRREKPNYYDSQEFDKKKKKKDRRVSDEQLICFEKSILSLPTNVSGSTESHLPGNPAS